MKKPSQLPDRFGKNMKPFLKQSHSALVFLVEVLTVQAGVIKL
ncbi:hypothetical protein RGAI101_2816 [Roseobacter sp. GAI101]|nr:hypothetical protein RGAI101_2816 [Roseobacter sp. GAI101]